MGGLRMVDLKKELEESVARWRSMGHLSLLEYFVLRNGVVREGQPRPDDYDKDPDKECFANAARLSQDVPGLHYVEGMAVSETLGWPMHHAWCEDGAGRVVDTTWGKPEDCTYMGVRIDGRKLVECLLRYKVYGLFDTGRGLNTELMYEIDPDLEAEVERYLAEARSRR